MYLTSYSMELSISTSLLHTLSRASLCPYASKCSFNCNLLNNEKFGGRLICNSKPIGEDLGMSSKDCSLNAWEDSEFVEVIGIGSRKEAVLDFCLDSSLRSSALRIWNILVKDSVKVQLQQRILEKDITSGIVEAPLDFQSCPKAVAGAAYGSDHTSALDILKTVKSANGLVVGIILKPFRFEGRRRQNEVNILVDKLQELTNFIIIIDTDALLEKDLVTLDEALKTANSAVLTAMNAISILTSDSHIKYLDLPPSDMKELKVPELKKILGNYKDAKIGFGSGYNIKTSIIRALYECPFLGVSIKDLNGIVVCIISSSGGVDSSDMPGTMRAFRQTTECSGTVIISVVHEPNLDPNLILTTIVTLGYIRPETSQKGGIFSRLAQHFPFIFNLLGKHHLQSHSIEENGSIKSPRLSEVINSPDSGEMTKSIPVDGIAQGFDIDSPELQTLLSNNQDDTYSLRDDSNSYQSEFEQSTLESEVDSDSPTYSINSEGAPNFQWESISRQNIGLGYQIENESTTNSSGAPPVLDNRSLYKLPIGVKPLEASKVSCDTFDNSIHQPEKIGDDDIKPETQITGNYADISKKQGGLSVRAASMLDAERDSQKKWSPNVEIKYRGGSYIGRCQGGLPEGKGRLSLGDGSVYDGMWRYGKRSGLGAFYFNNGDVFRGSWRDDVMHGKGWFYFNTGDRWFANFWKGKANGEGRFYSKNGDVFFGHFKDGWRDGHFLCINVDGTRYLEIWDEGVLVSREQLESDAGAG